ncbi:MAG: 50S ribosomal protein L22, partial [Nanoarchaeota archaeon]|nr:50S ribosomal protein L22 [Nanoarchaeota archaeon]
MVYNYSTKIKENMAKAVLVAAPFSSKQGIEISNAIRGKDLSRAKKILESIISMEKPIKYTRFNKDTGHKPGIGPGRYPIKAATLILELLNSAEANAIHKGLNIDSLIVYHISTQRSSRPLRYGRQRGRLGKRATIELVLEEQAKKKEKKQEKKVSTSKTEVKKETSKAEPKKEEVKVKETKEEVKTESKVEAKPVEEK